MARASFNHVATALGKTFTAQRVLDTDGAVVKNPTLSAAKTGTLTTRTDNDTGTCTMTAGHGFSTSDRIDLYWSGGRRYGMTATVTGDSVVLDGGTGDNLPLVNTVITAMEPVLLSFPVTAANLKGLILGAFQPPTSQGSIAPLNIPCQAVIRDDTSPTPVVLEAPYSSGSSSTYQWEAASGVDNPLSDDAVEVYLSHGGTVAAQVSLSAFVDD